ncbi:acyl-CoA dehydrogenase family protein [Agromyces seonyuensis]|uniref:Acyl-CoA dehydrogenase n=1 Tax=Agromyces seonyuensis TaxID=2662446 RepID=A0A6I4NX28_9MICO|nr:acyl-CoA dehydrogenase family protein [Agromyces seonyuensis]MWB98850.1 acyl-CoA dehydrogenase [Agromyces seonyuensis]
MSFEPLASDFYGFESLLTEPEQEALGKLRAWLESDVKPIIGGYWERAEFPRQIVAPLAELGVLSFAWDETKPFENSSVFRGFVALELARVDASVATFVGVQNGLATGAISICGSQAQREEWIPKLASGEVIGAFGLTEPLSGSDSAQGLRTTAKREGDEWVLNGSKRWIGNATWSDITVIWAKDVEDGQVKGFIVPTSTPGYSATKIEGKISLRPVQNADITLTDVRIPHALKLEHANSFKDTAKVLKATRGEVAWESVGTAVGAYEAAVAYSKERIQFGKPIGSHQLVQDLLVKSLGNITASIAMVHRLSVLQDEGKLTDEHAALAKLYATTRMRETVAWARESMGGNGIVLDYDAARFFADAEALYSYEGTREMNTLIVGRAITGKGAFV